VRLQEIGTARVRRAGATAGEPAGMASRQAAPAAWGVLEAQQQPQPVRAPGGATAGQAAGVGVLRSRQQRASKQQVTQQPPQLRRQQPVQLPRACQVQVLLLSQPLLQLALLVQLVGRQQQHHSAGPQHLPHRRYQQHGPRQTLTQQRQQQPATQMHWAHR
jgi:hypothetical protein